VKKNTFGSSEDLIASVCQNSLGTHLQQNWIVNPYVKVAKISNEYQGQALIKEWLQDRL
jgi:hypothetical protein